MDFCSSPSHKEYYCHTVCITGILYWTTHRRGVIPTGIISFYTLFFRFCLLCFRCDSRSEQNTVAPLALLDVSCKCVVEQSQIWQRKNNKKKSPKSCATSRDTRWLEWSKLSQSWMLLLCFDYMSYVRSASSVDWLLHGFFKYSTMFLMEKKPAENIFSLRQSKWIHSLLFDLGLF